MKKRNISSSLKIVLAILIGLIGVTVCHAEPVEIHGTVTAVEEETMTIDLGEPQKLMPGIRGEVYYEISIGDATKPILIGEFEVTAVGESESRARLLNRRGEIRPGRLVRLTLDIPPGVGSLKTFSEPAGAQVALDDKDVGQTKPEGLVLESIPSGLHTVRLTRQFYRPTVRTVIVLPEAMTTLKVNLEQNWGNLGVTSDPPGAEVQVEEGNTKGHEEHKARTPYTFEHLPAGTYEVNAQAEGYYPWKGQVVIDNEATTRLEAQLVKHAVLIISVHPASAMVSMDGGPEQAAPPRLSGIPLGKHTLTAHAPDFERQTVEVTLRAGEEKRLSVTLNRARVALLVHSAPEGADVALDGEVKGKTPLQMAEVLTGEHTLRLSLDGYETIERSLTVHESPEPIALTLKPSIGRIQINSTPAGASIHLKGEIMGLTPHTLELRPGEQTLELRLTAYRTALQTIQLQPGTNPPVTVQLERQRGTLRITSTPAEATIALNGERRDERTPAEFVLPPGEYTVAIEHENYEPYTETVTLADQAVQPIEATLPHQTQLRVTSDPAGIDVDLGALGRHKTMHQAAVLLRDVSPGTYEATAKVKGYQPLKQRFEVTPHQYNTLAIQLSPKSRLDMAGSSLLLPGSGQYYGERYVSGTFFLLMEVGAIVSAIVAYQEYDQALVRYHRAEEQYRNAVMLSEIQDARQKLVKAHDAAERKLVFQQAAFGAIGGVWALNVLHAMIAGPAGLRHESDLASKYGEVSLEWVRYPGSNDYVFGGIGFLPLRITNQSRSIGKIGISCAIGLDRGSIEDTLEQLSDETIRRLGPSGQIAISAFFFNNPRQPIVPFLRGIARIPNEVIRGKGGDIRFGFEGGLYLLYRQTVALQFGLNVSDTRDIQRSGGPVGIRFGLSLLP